MNMVSFSGKVVIIVNGASECGLTQTNYVQLKELLDKYKSQGLEIAVFPSNEFGGQVNALKSIKITSCFRSRKVTPTSRSSWLATSSLSPICTPRLRWTARMHTRSTNSWRNSREALSPTASSGTSPSFWSTARAESLSVTHRLLLRIRWLRTSRRHWPSLLKSFCVIIFDGLGIKY